MSKKDAELLRKLSGILDELKTAYPKDYPTLDPHLDRRHTPSFGRVSTRTAIIHERERLANLGALLSDYLNELAGDCGVVTIHFLNDILEKLKLAYEIRVLQQAEIREFGLEAVIKERIDLSENTKIFEDEQHGEETIYFYAEHIAALIHLLIELSQQARNEDLLKPWTAEESEYPKEVLFIVSAISGQLAVLVEKLNQLFVYSPENEQFELRILN